MSGNDKTDPENIRTNQEVVDLFRRASRLMARTFHQQDHAHHAQAHVLSIIREKGEINQRDLLEILDVRSSSLSEILRKLENNGLIMRRKSDTDKRSFIVQAADVTESSGPDDADIRRQSADSLFSCLSDQERGQLGNILEKLIDNLKDTLPEQNHFKGHHKRGHGHHKHGGGRHNPFHGKRH